MKKIFVLSFALASLASNAFAATANFGGAYAGGALDRHSFSVRNQEAINEGSRRFYGAALLGGWGHQFANNVYLGGEAQVNLTHLAKARDDGFKFKPRAAVVARLGYAVEKFMPYVLAGVEVGDYKLPNSHGSSGHFLAAKKGFGLEYALCDHMRVRGEFSVADYHNTSLKNYQDGGNQYIRLQNRTFRVGLTYKF